MPFSDELPLGKASDYTLKPWDGDDAWYMIIAVPPKFSQNDIEQARDWEQARFLLLREVVSRFPNSPHYAAAFSLLISLGGNSQIGIGNYELEPFRRALEAALNAEANIEISPDTLNAILSQSLHLEGFNVEEVFPANNVLNDDAPGWILEIRTSAWSEAVFALAGKPGSYRLVSPYQYWSLLWHGDRQVSAEDLNANGIPEIAIRESQWGAGMSHFCSDSFDLFEWNGSNFVNLTPDITADTNTDTGECLGFEFVSGPNNTQAITTGILINSGCHYGEYGGQSGVGSLVVKRRYKWNGAYFALAGEEVLSLEDSMPAGEPLNRCTLSWVNEAGAANDQAFQLLPTLLTETDPGLTAGFIDQFGPAYLDFFRFKLGAWYAMRGQQAQALALLTQVRDNPDKPEFDAASRLAEAFLQSYPSASAYAGCVAASKELDIYAFQSEGSDLLYLDATAMRAAWGFSDQQWTYLGCSAMFSGPSGREDPLNVCSLTTAFRLAAQKQKFTSTQDLIQWLDGQQIPYTGLQEGDVDGDGQRDWLILLGTGQNQSWHLWALLDTGASTLPLWVADIHRATGNIPAVWNTFTPNPSDGPLNVYQWTDGMVIFRLVFRNGWTGVDVIHQPIGYYQGESFLGFTVRPAAEGSAEELYVLLVGEESWETDWYVLGWDPAINTLHVASSPWIDQNRQVQAAESLLFERSDPQEALEILVQLLSEENESIDGEMQKFDTPYLQYLLGLAYEMSGDEQSAVSAYWTLWHDFPLHPLSYVVQQKLARHEP
jgi:hypothetical protein